MFEEDSGRTSSIGKAGKRRWLYPVEISGRFKKYRRLVAYLLFLLAVILPFLTISGHPVLRFDPFEFKMYIMGMVFWPQELKLFFPLVLGVVMLIVTVTTAYGRIWCGWGCPQTIFLHFFYAEIERFVEGKAIKRRKRDEGSATVGWAIKKAVKHILFIALSLLIGNVFLLYFLGPDALFNAILHSPAENPFAFKVMLFIATFFYINFAFIKEVMCTIACPYARLQSVLTDNHSLLINYDYKRGEPRSVSASKRSLGDGDCVNCGMCVNVCPTGIDIRKGQQLECVGCALCIDACNATMERNDLPKGLIRYASERQLTYANTKILRPRFYIYTAITIICFVLFFTILISRSELQVNLTRVKAVPYIIEDDGEVRNMFTLRIRNKKHTSMDITIKSQLEGVRSNLDNTTITIPASTRSELTFITWIDRRKFIAGKNESIFTIRGEGVAEILYVVSPGPSTIEP